MGRLVWIVLLLAGGWMSTGLAAVDPPSGEEQRAAREGRWSLAFENDLLAGGERDKDYTYGLNLVYSGLKARDFHLSPWPIQRHLDAFWSPRQRSSSPIRLENHSLELGVYGFTPDNIHHGGPRPGDRPYASLVYLQSTRENVDHLAGRSWTSSLSLGVLGLDLVGSAQNQLHAITGSDRARGWAHQISDGGEPTFRYSVAYQQHWLRERPRVELKSTTQLSLGYMTELSYGLSFRSGKIRSSWWSFDPELASYGERSSPLSGRSRVAEHYLWGGVAVKARAYNAFLQGQFRHSDVALGGDQLNHFLVEGWLGYTVAFSNGYRLSYWLRGHSSEIKDGPGDRDLFWGGIILSKSF